ncbi:TPA: hypothetical protein ACFOTX_001604 [Neisseria meningitidis]
MPSEPSDGIFDLPAVDKRGAGVEIPEPSFPIHRNLEPRHSRQHRNLETRHSRQYRNLEIRHSRAGGNPDP